MFQAKGARRGSRALPDATSSMQTISGTMYIAFEGEVHLESKTLHRQSLNHKRDIEIFVSGLSCRTGMTLC